jgi:hypothetical protein
MATNNNPQQSQPGPIAQQLTKLQSNGHQTSSNGHQLPLGQPPKRTSWTGFSDRTLWDWIQFFAVLALPIIVAAGTLYYTQQITLQQTQASERQHQTDLQIVVDQQREDVLVNYQKDVSDLMLNYHLASSKEFDAVRLIARAKTLTTLRKLDPDRKRLLIQFLEGASLSGADLSKANLKGTNTTVQQLAEAKSLKGATMPDGSIHP